MKRACAYYLERGFTAIKFGWGVFGQDRQRDIALVAAARAGDRAGRGLVGRSRLDGQPQRLRCRIELLRQLEPYNIFWLEDFLHPEDYDGYARVKEAGVKTRLAAGEQEATAWGFRELITRGKIDVAQPDLSRCGGFTQARKIMWEAQCAGVDVCPHAWLTDLLSAASLHVNACLERSLFLEYNVCDNPMLRDVIRNPIQMDADGMIPVPQEPGLGIEVDEQAVERYRVEEC